MTAEPVPTLRGGRVTLRPLSDADLDVLVPATTLPSIAEWWGTPDSPEREREGLVNDFDGGAFAIEVGDALAGWLGFNEELEPDYKHASLDIFLLPEHQGRGLGAAALRLAIRWLIDARGHHRFTIDPACRNERAIRAYAAVGFKPVGVMRAYERTPDGRWMDGLLMDLLADELTTD
ncbi:MAG TPA: GNAT family protein [Conexibacter sp.]|nr:GNAT family protein [Conexibacter sp.]